MRHQSKPEKDILVDSSCPGYDLDKPFTRSSQSADPDRFDDDFLCQCATMNRYDGLTIENDKIVPGPSSFSEIVKQSAVTSQPEQFFVNNSAEQFIIPLHLSNRHDKRVRPWSCVNEFSVNGQNFRNNSDRQRPDDDFIKHIRRRPIRYYIGGFKASMTEKMIVHCVEKGHNCVMGQYSQISRSGPICIQLNDDPERGDQLLERGHLECSVDHGTLEMNLGRKYQLVMSRTKTVASTHKFIKIAVKVSL